MNKSFTSVAFRAALVSAFCSSMFMACRKDNKSGDNSGGNTGITTTAVTDEDSLKYLMYHTMQVSYVDGGRSTNTSLPTYYWYSQVPVLDPVSSTYATADALLEVMKTYSKGSGSTALDRYSFLDRTGSLSSALQDGVSEVNRKVSATGTYGIEVSYAADADNNTYLQILYADKNSPAGLKGLTRGDEITAINGDTALSYDGSSGAHVKKVIAAIYNSTSVTLAVRKFKATTSSNYAITAGSYNINPVLFDTTYTVGDKKVGYFVFYTFTSTVNTKGAYTNTKTILDAVFSKFKAAGVTNLIVDLRYNGGGSVTTAEYLDSAIVNASAAGKPMYYYTYNDKLTANASDAGLESSVNFPSSTGGLPLSNVFFITSKNTASASELTLNNLKPYMNVKLVGDSTYGKPVGFITFTINKYDSTHTEKYLADLYAINFATENANHVGGYFSGIAPDQAAIDYIDVPWGNANDDNLNYIFSYISNGSFTRSSSSERLAVQQSLNLRASVKASVVSPRFNGMVDYRLGKRLKN
jgi:C-terminal processing protease CtpA/Prc